MEIAVIEKALTEEITAKYELKASSEKYTILIQERNSHGQIICSARAELEASLGKGAKQIFDSLHENGVFAIHLNDIISDLLC